MGNSAKFVQSFHAAKNVFFGGFALEKLQNGHCQFTAHIIKDLKEISFLSMKNKTWEMEILFALQRV